MLAIAIPVLVIGLYFMTWGFRFLVIGTIAVSATALNYADLDRLPLGACASVVLLMSPFLAFGAGIFFSVLRAISSSPEKYRARRNAILKFASRWTFIYLAFAAILWLTVSAMFGDEHGEVFMLLGGPWIFATVLAIALIHRRRAAKRQRHFAPDATVPPATAKRDG